MNAPDLIKVFKKLKDAFKRFRWASCLVSTCYTGLCRTATRLTLSDSMAMVQPAVRCAIGMAMLCYPNCSLLAVCLVGCPPKVPINRLVVTFFEIEIIFKIISPYRYTTKCMVGAT